MRSATERGEAAFTQVERAVGEADQWVNTMASSAAAGNTFAQEITAKLDGLTLQIAQKAGVDGRLFDSVTNYDIVEALTKQGHEVERSQVRMPDWPLKQVGEYKLQVALHPDVIVAINVAVLGES